MNDYDTIEEDLKRAKQILAKGRPETDEQSPTFGAVSGGTIFGADIYAAYKLLESFVQYIETHFRPDHNGECLNCDEPEEAHATERCDFPEHLELMVDLANTLATLAELRNEIKARGDIIELYERQLAQRDAEARQLRAKHPDFKVLASAMRKVLPPALLADVIAHLDPLTPFVAFLQAHDPSPDK